MTCHDLFELKLYGQVELNRNILALMFTTDPSDVLTLHEFHDTQGLFSASAAYIPYDFWILHPSFVIYHKLNDHHARYFLRSRCFRVTNMFIDEFQQFLLRTLFALFI